MLSERRAIVLPSLTVLFLLMIVLIPGGGLVDLTDGFVPDTGPHLLPGTFPTRIVPFRVQF